MRTPEQRMFLNVITQAVHDASYKGEERYDVYHRDQAISWLTSNSYDFRMVCKLADLDPDYAHTKLQKAIDSDIYKIRADHYKKQKPGRKNPPGRYRLMF